METDNGADIPNLLICTGALDLRCCSDGRTAQERTARGIAGETSPCTQRARRRAAVADISFAFIFCGTSLLPGRRSYGWSDRKCIASRTFSRWARVDNTFGNHRASIVTLDLLYVFLDYLPLKSFATGLCIISINYKRKLCLFCILYNFSPW